MCGNENLVVWHLIEVDCCQAFPTGYNHLDCIECDLKFWYPWRKILLRVLHCKFGEYACVFSEQGEENGNIPHEAQKTADFSG